MRQLAQLLLVLAALLAAPQSARGGNKGKTADGACTELVKGAQAPADNSTEFGTYDQFSEEQPGGTDYSVLTPATGPGLHFRTNFGPSSVTAANIASKIARDAQSKARAGALLAACAKLQGGTECDAGALKLGDFQQLYQEAPQPPALAAFWDSDAAFARMRLTVAPLLIRLATALPGNMTADDIEGLDGIIAGTGLSLDELLAAKRVFVQDYAPFAARLTASPGHVLEAPTALFFLDGADGKAPGAGLMPLAIKFNLQNDNVYSPKDSRADWLLAKTTVNTVDTYMHASIHFLLHLVLENYCISGDRNLSPTHPLYDLVSIPCFGNAVINVGGSEALFNEGANLDSLMASRGQSTLDLAMSLLKEYDWERTYPAADMAERGLDALPAGQFPYRDDSAALYAALEEYATAIVAAHYADGAAVAGDAQAQAFLADLAEGGAGEIPGFPSPADIQTPQQLARVVAKMMWFGGVQHHSINSNKVVNYDFSYPIAAGKIFKAAPAMKGELSEGDIVSQYLLPPVSTTYPANSTTNSTAFWAATQAAASLFILSDAEQELANRLPRCYSAAAAEAAGCPKAAAHAAAATKLEAELAKIGAAIEAREAATKDTLPQYTLLVPENLPCSTTI